MCVTGWFLMIKSGKKTKAWNADKIALKKLFQEKGITDCELRLPGCTNYFLTWAHRHKRSFYWSQPELLRDFCHVLLACVHCHQIIEKDPKLTEEMFAKLR